MTYNLHWPRLLNLPQMFKTGNRIVSYCSATLVVLVILLLLPTETYSQAEPQPDDFEYSSEFNFGINFNTNARLVGGGTLKYAWLARKNQYHSLGLDFVNMSHPKESNVANQFTGSTFTPYKLAYAIILRPTYGREFLLFRKGVEEGVHLNARFAAGLAMAAMKPYYVLYDVTNRRDPTRATSVRYNPTAHQLGDIYGSGNLFQGINEVEFIPGATAKAALAFEFGRFNGSVIGIETGVNLDYFSKELPILHGVDNYRGWSSLYLTLYYGSKNK